MTAPSTRTTTLEQALDHIATEPVIWVRVAATRDDAGVWQARLLELTSGDAPPSWDEKGWEYPMALFTAQRLDGPEVVTCLQSRTMRFGPHAIALPEMTNVMTWERRQSRSPTAYEALDWPVTETRLCMMVGGAPEPQGPLVSEGDAPSFVSYYAAGACFFWFDRQPVGGQLSQSVMYRHQDIRTRIKVVKIADDSVEIDVEGTDIDGLIVELSSDIPGPIERIRTHHSREPQTVRFDLNEGLPSGFWVLVRRGGQWLDRRFLSVPYARGNEAGRP